MSGGSTTTTTSGSSSSGGSGGDSSAWRADEGLEYRTSGSAHKVRNTSLVDALTSELVSSTDLLTDATSAIRPTRSSSNAPSSSFVNRALSSRRASNGRDAVALAEAAASGPGSSTSGKSGVDFGADFDLDFDLDLGADLDLGGDVDAGVGADVDADLGVDDGWLDSKGMENAVWLFGGYEAAADADSPPDALTPIPVPGPAAAPPGGSPASASAPNGSAGSSSTTTRGSPEAKAVSSDLEVNFVQLRNMFDKIEAGEPPAGRPAAAGTDEASNDPSSSLCQGGYLQGPGADGTDPWATVPWDDRKQKAKRAWQSVQEPAEADLGWQPGSGGRSARGGRRQEQQAWGQGEGAAGQQGVGDAEWELWDGGGMALDDVGFDLGGEAVGEPVGDGDWLVEVGAEEGLSGKGRGGAGAQKQGLGQSQNPGGVGKKASKAAMLKEESRLRKEAVSGAGQGGGILGVRVSAGKERAEEGRGEKERAGRGGMGRAGEGGGGEEWAGQGTGGKERAGEGTGGKQQRHHDG